ncbi:MAG TPA: hemolysin family protein [Nocardioidaceae bacterium]|nr:hemolysin family protein [Nocardioidaceae bacterium]
MGDAVPLLLAVGLLLANAFFVGAEFALVAARRTQIQPLADEGSARAGVTLSAMRRVSLMMAGAQLGITLCTLGLGAVGEPAVAHLLEPVFHAVGVPDAWLHLVAFVVATLVVVALHVVVGEMVPKNLALAAPDRSALVLGPPMAALVRFSRPVILGLNAMANATLRLLRVPPQDEVSTAVSGEEVGEMADEARREGLMDAEEHSRVARSLEFGSSCARDVTIERSAVATLESGATPRDVEQTAAATGHSRFPVVDSEGRWRHYVHLKDVVDRDASRADSALADAELRPLPTVPPDAGLVDVLNSMRDGSTHVVAVRAVDGGVQGLVVLDDVLLALLPRRDAA